MRRSESVSARVHTQHLRDGCEIRTSLLVRHDVVKLFDPVRQLNEIAVSRLATLDGLTQFRFRSPRVCQQAIGTTGHLRSNMREGRFCAILFLAARNSLILKRRDVRVVEGARLESVCRGNSTVGSNPTLSANFVR